MLIAHLPSGYLVGRAVAGRDRALMTAALIGSVFPDLDMLWFHLIDGRQTHHHAYVTHWPVVYLAVLLLSALTWKTAPRWSRIGAAFAVAALVHMLLDTVAAPLRWLAPFSDRWFEIVTVPATHANWVLSFVTHWTFALELTICCAAAALLIHRRQESAA